MLQKFRVFAEKRILDNGDLFPGVVIVSYFLCYP